MPNRTEVFQRRHEADHQRSAWMARAQQGDRSAYRMLLGQCFPHVRRMAIRMGVGSADADDVVQETLIALHQARDSFEPGRSFTAWLNAIARRRVVDNLRRRGRLAAREIAASRVDVDACPDPSRLPEETHMAEQRRVRLLAEISKLPSGQGKALEALRLREQTLDEAAAETGRTKGALKVALHRGLNTLQARLGAERREGLI